MGSRISFDISLWVKHFLTTPNFCVPYSAAAINFSTWEDPLQPTVKDYSKNFIFCSWFYLGLASVNASPFTVMLMKDDQFSLGCIYFQTRSRKPLLRLNQFFFKIFEDCTNYKAKFWLEKSCREHFCTKKLPVKCWWNWHQQPKNDARCKLKMLKNIQLVLLV
jgi:hypothetical protein